MENRGENVYVGHFISFQIDLIDPPVLLEFAKNGDICLVAIEVSPMKKGPLLKKLLSMIPCDGNDRLFIEILRLECREEISHKRVDISN